MSFRIVEFPIARRCCRCSSHQLGCFQVLWVGPCSHVVNKEVCERTIFIHREVVQHLVDQWYLSIITEASFGHSGIKKSTLDPFDLGNYRPISNLTFVPKLLERVAHEQIIGYTSDNHLLPDNQSAYQKHRSTETATLKVLSDVYQAADMGKITLLGMLDLSAAFDTVDHQILLNRLQHSFDITGTVLQ